MINHEDLIREFWFKINIQFSPVEFVVVIGLLFGHDTEVSNYVNSLGTL